MGQRKRYIIECVNHLLKDKGNWVHSRHRSINNFLMNIIAAICAYCFFDNKPEAIKGYCVKDTKQLTFFQSYPELTYRVSFCTIFTLYCIKYHVFYAISFVS